MHPHPSVVGEIVGGEAVLLLPHLGQVKVLNDVGTHIWSLCDGTRTVGQIAADVTAVFAVAETTAQHDVLEFMHDLLARGCIVLEDAR